MNLPPIKAITTAEDIAFMERNKEKIVETVGFDEYDRLIQELRDFEKSKESSNG